MRPEPFLHGRIPFPYHSNIAIAGHNSARSPAFRSEVRKIETASVALKASRQNGIYPPGWDIRKNSCGYNRRLRASAIWIVSNHECSRNRVRHL
jgi:hypothetical protein